MNQKYIAMNKEGKREIIEVVIAWLAIIGAIWFMFCFSACSSTREIEKVYVHDTLRTTNVRVDSVDRWHTHYEYLLGDTCFIRDTFFVTRWRVETKTDTLIDHITDTKTDTRIEERKVYVWWPCLVCLGLLLIGLLLFVGWRLWEFSDRRDSLEE